MSLLRRLLLSVSVALLVVLAAALAFNLHAARNYLSEQLRVQSENAAVSLALSLSQPGNQDPAVQELLMSALFDSGKFALVRLNAVDGQVLFVRQQTLGADAAAIPTWFQRWLPLPQATADREVSVGWQQLGTVHVTADNAYAHEVLWRSSWQLVMFVVVAGLLWAIFVWALLRWFQRVLREEVSAQVLQIGQAQTPASQAGNVATVAELQAVSDAIHRTHERVQQQTQTQSQRIGALELEILSDPVTGLPNRKYFLQALQNALSGASDGQQGWVLLCRIRDLQRMNAKIQRQQVDAWLQGVGEQMHAMMAQYPEVQAQWARLNGSDFALMLQPGAGSQGMRMVQHVRTLLKSLNVQLDHTQWSRWAFALQPYTQADSAAQLMVRLDQGLMQAESGGHDTWSPVAPGHGMPAHSEWSYLLRTALEASDSMELVVQQRVFARREHAWVRDDASWQVNTDSGGVLSADMLWPVVLRMGLAADVDLRVLTLGLQWLQQHAVEQLLTVKISVAALEHPSFLADLQTLLARTPQPLGQLVFEIDAHAVAQHPETALQLAQKVQSHGIGLGVRGIERSWLALLHLQALRPRYVQFSGHFVEQSLYNTGAAQLMAACVATAQAAGAQVLIVGAVSPAVASRYSDDGVAFSPPPEDT